MQNITLASYQVSHCIVGLPRRRKYNCLLVIQFTVDCLMDWWNSHQLDWTVWWGNGWVGVTVFSLFWVFANQFSAITVTCSTVRLAIVLTVNSMYYVWCVSLTVSLL